MPNNTVSSSQTNVGAGMQQHSYYTDALGTQKNPPSVTVAKVEIFPGITEEEKLFFETVYGEAAGQGVVAWAAVASVIMNRVGKYEWHRLTTVTQVITQRAAFSAYQNKKGLPDAQFTLAKNYLDHPQGQPPEDLYKLIQVVYPFYKKLAKPITPALFYFSPPASISSRLEKDVKNGSVVKIEVEGVSDKDFIFYTYASVCKENPQQC